MTIAAAHPSRLEGVRRIPALDGIRALAVSAVVGGQGCYEVLRREAMLHSRLYGIVRFQELSDPECCQVLPAFHPLYVGVAPELIIHINRQCTLGNFRLGRRSSPVWLSHVSRNTEEGTNDLCRSGLGRGTPRRRRDG